MMHVSSKSLLLLFVSATLLSGCEDPAVSVSSLGRKIAAPVLTSSSPFDQDLDVQGYVHISGTCDSRVGPIELSFDNTNWKYAPSSTSVTTTNTTTYTNDNDCSDGKFDIYLSKSDISSIWGIDTSNNNNSVTNVYIKGETLFGDTHTLNIPNDKSTTGAPVKIVLRKLFPSGFGGAGLCEMFTAVVVDSNGNETSARSDITFGLSSPSVTFSAFASATDCASTSNPVTTFTIIANTSNSNIFVKMPSSPVDTSIGFQLTTPSSLAVSATATPVVLRDPSSTHRFVYMTDAPNSIYKNVCYPATLQIFNYNKSTSTTTSSTVTMNLNPADSNLQFFTAAGCGSSSKTSSLAFAAGTSSVSAYIMYSTTSTSTNTFNVGVTTSVSDSNFDNSPFGFRVDTSDKSAVAKFDFGGPNTLTRSTCHAYTLMTVNTNWTNVPADADYTFTFNSNGTGALSFYSDSACASSASSVTLSQGQVSKKFYVKSLAAQSVTDKIVVNTTKFGQVSRDVAISVVASNSVLNMATSYTIPKDQCTYIGIQFMDYTGAIIPPTNPINLAFFTSGGVGSYVSLYADSSCTTSYAESVYAPISPYDSTQYKLYMKVNGSFPDTNLIMYFQGTGLFTLPIITGNFTIQ